MADRYFDFRSGRFTGAEGTYRKESVLAAMLVWRRHVGARERVPLDALPGEVGVGRDTVEAYRSTLRRLFASSGLSPFDEERPYKESALGVRAQIPSDLADLLDAARKGDGPRLRALTGDPRGWQEFRQLLRSRPRGAWATDLDRAIRDAHVVRRRPRASEPPPRCELVGRDDDLREIAEAFETHPVVVLHGPAGIGKTALATEIAHLHVGADLWVDLKDVDGDDWDEVDAVVYPLDGAEEVQADAEDLVPARDVGDADQRLSRAFRFAVARSLDFMQVPWLEAPAIAEALDLHMGESGPMLVVLDDCPVAPAACGTLVRDLRDHCRRGGDLRFLVTCRSRLGLDPDMGHEQEVAELPREADGRDPAVDLFVQAVRAKAGSEHPYTSDQLDEIARICERRGRVPLGIMVAAAERAQGASLSKLLERQVGDDDLGDGFDRLPPETRQLLARLSVFGGPFDVTTAAQVVDMPRHAFEQAARPLIGTYLLPVEAAPRAARYEVERSERDRYEAALAEQDDRAAVRRRLLDHLLDHFRYRSETGRIAWRAHVQPELETAAGFLRTALDDDEPMEAETVDLILELVPLWIVEGMFTDAGRLVARVVDAIRDRKDVPPAARARLVCARGMTWWYRHDVARTKSCFEMALKLAQEAGDPAVVAEAEVGLGYGTDEVVHFESAAERLDELSTPLPPVAAATAAAAHTGMGWRCYHRSEYPGAWEHFNVAEGIASSVGEDRETIEALLGLGWVARRRCDFPSADEFFTRAHEQATALGDRNLRATALNARGELAHAAGQLERARELLQQGRELAAVSHVNAVASRLEGSEGELRRAAATSFGDLQAARRLLLASRDAAKRNDVDSEEAWRHFGLGQIEFLLETPEQARKRFERSRTVADEYHDAWQIARCDQRLARLSLLAASTDEQLLEAVRELLDAARRQDRLGVLDDLSWTVQDLAYAAYRLGAPELAAQLTGARFQLDSLIAGRQRIRILRSAKRDWYADEVARACDAAHAALGEQAWDEQVAAGERRAAACPFRSLSLVLDDVEAWAAARGGEAGDAEARP
jgi:tetratricopeptide (TPR) repeat protein